MKTAFVFNVVVGATLLSSLAQTKDVNQTATIVTMNAVSCGTKGGRLLKTGELPCREYVLRSGSTEYHILQKVEKKTDLLALGQKVTFTIHSDRMRVHATNKNGKSGDYEFTLVLITAASEVNPPRAPQQ